MCGRFNITEMPGLQQLLNDLRVDARLPEPRYNVAPTEDVFLLHDGRGEQARWWLVPSWADEAGTKYSMFNARAESLSKSAAFKKPFQSQRGIVPMSSFLEWRKEGGEKQPWLITNEDRTLAVAALWDVWEGQQPPLLSCTIVTTEAAPQFKPWHNRMPVMLDRQEMQRWLNNEQTIAPNDSLFRAELKYRLYLNPLPKAVGNSRNKEPSLMEPVAETVELSPD